MMDYYDALASLGVTSAHPGGYQTTVAWLTDVQIKPGDRVLEIGCGLGRTACEIAQRFGAEVTAVDLRHDMIEKARLRARTVGASVNFLQVRRGKLPFPDQHYKWLIAESVSVFNDIATVLREYFRVLCTGGTVIDVEMCAAAPLPAPVMADFRSLYHAVRVPLMMEWKTLFREASFSPVRILLSGAASAASNADMPDLQYTSPSPSISPDLQRVAAENQRVMATHGKWLQYCIIEAVKPSVAAS